MSDTTNKHAEAIRDDIYQWVPDPSIAPAIEHLDALASDLAAANARADAWDAEAHLLVGKLGDMTIERDAAAARLDGICRIARDAHDERADRLAAIEEIYAIAYGVLSPEAQP